MGLLTATRRCHPMPDAAMRTGRGRHADRDVRARKPAGNRDVSRRRLAVVLLSAAALSCLAHAGWIHAKAMLAQVLLERAWNETLAEGGTHRPWPWADTWPVAKIHAPRLRQAQIVLAGDDGRALAFGPGWAQASGVPGRGGITVISGHRDTHFAWLAQLQAGDRLQLDGVHGTRSYAVTGTRVADSRHERIDVHSGDDRLLLVTCWPFDAVVPGGPLRYVVSAQPVDDAAAQALEPE
ncbi:class GN sortase [Pseudofulvimonas gallinarii]|uniref:Sortase A n=1 Tax=Pseudofulvimonas gallinarii TaxID=634155 RepID=A0A4R3L7X8_9GAMM|nr:class GN sortase [Pseudofulvimonas gallinarii]TCS95248.1 sortase A [Pseudofulvimonas gallinarii]